MSMLETKIERKACKILEKEYGVENIKLVANRGYPDRLFLIPGGKPFMIEFKRPGESPTSFQLYVHNKLRKLGYTVEVHYKVETAVDAVLKQMGVRHVVSI